MDGVILVLVLNLNFFVLVVNMQSRRLKALSTLYFREHTAPYLYGDVIGKVTGAASF